MDCETEPLSQQPIDCHNIGAIKNYYDTLDIPPREKWAVDRGPVEYNCYRYVSDLHLVATELVTRIPFHNREIDREVSGMHTGYWEGDTSKLNLQNRKVDTKGLVQLLLILGVPVIWIKLSSTVNWHHPSLPVPVGESVVSINPVENDDRYSLRVLWSSLWNWKVNRKLSEDINSDKQVIEEYSSTEWFVGGYTPELSPIQRAWVTIYNLSTGITLLQWFKRVLFGSGQGELTCIDYALTLKDMRFNKNPTICNNEPTDLISKRMCTHHLLQEIFENEQLCVSTIVNEMCGPGYSDKPEEFLTHDNFYEPNHDRILSVVIHWAAYMRYIPRATDLMFKSTLTWFVLIDGIDPDKTLSELTKLVPPSQYGRQLSEHSSQSDKTSFNKNFVPDRDPNGPYSFSNHMIQTQINTWDLLSMYLQNHYVIHLPNKYYMAFQEPNLCSFDGGPIYWHVYQFRWFPETLQEEYVIIYTPKDYIQIARDKHPDIDFWENMTLFLDEAERLLEQDLPDSKTYVFSEQLLRQKHRNLYLTIKTKKRRRFENKPY